MKWICLSTSSPIASVALFDDAVVLGTAGKEARRQASAAVFELLDAVLSRAGTKLQDIELFGADLGPGSFTGVRVGVTVTKTLAFTMQKRVAGFSAFDLIAATGARRIPARRGAFLYTANGNEPIELPESDSRLENAVGYGGSFKTQFYPSAARAGEFFESMNVIPPEQLLPEYILEPSISTPKKPFSVTE